MNKQEIYDWLESRGIEFESVEHAPVLDMSGLSFRDMPHAGCVAKNLFLHDDRRSAYYMISIKGNKRFDIKDFRRRFGTRRLSFADDCELDAILCVKPGSVSPLCLLDDTKCVVRLFIDRDFMDNGAYIGVHPCDNTATLWLKVNDLIDVVAEHGNCVALTDI